MSKDSCSTRKPSQSLANENEFESPLNQIPLIPSRSPLNSIPDPSQFQSKTPNQQFHHDTKEKPQSSTQLTSSFTRAPSSRVYNRGKSAYSEPNSAPIRSGARVFNEGSTSLMRSPFQIAKGLGRLGILPRVSRGISVSIPQQVVADIPCFELEEDPLFWKDHNVQVLIRIRPLSETEMVSQGYGRCLRQESAHTVIWLGHPETRFTFDHIACETTSQEKLFRVAGLPMVDNCMSGYNSCMFAYGQTGSGKTYTMMGEIDKMDGKLSDDCGITPRIFEYLFTRIAEVEKSRKHERLAYSCKCSFLEIYNEHITDLLEPSSTNLQLREDLKKGVYVENLTEHSVRTVNDVLKLLQQGAANRKIAATYMNSESSRSHSVFTCIVESRWEKDSMAHLRFGRLNLVDLAGSERQKSSGAEGDRLKEAANINKSLSTLGLVIMSLVDLAQGKHRHIPYRDSRLTFLLQDSLGGNSKTTIIANVSPSTSSANETLSTLKFAQRAKLIQNNVYSSQLNLPMDISVFLSFINFFSYLQAKINEDASGDVIILQQQIQQLKGQLSFLMKNMHDSIKLHDFPPSPGQSCLGYILVGNESSKRINMYDEHKTQKEVVKTKYLKATLCGALRREKLAETEVRRLKAEIEHLNRLSHQREEEAQRSKMMLRFREEKIKRFELLSDGSISTDKFYLDENKALREENLLLQAKIDRNPEVIQFASENIKLLEQIRLYQDFYGQGERETLLAEISDLRSQVQEFEIAKELERCKDMNSTLIREVDELRDRLANGMKCDQDTSNSIENGLLKSDSLDEATSSNLPGDEVIWDKNDHKMEDIQFAETENQRLMKMLDDKETPQSKDDNRQGDYERKQVSSRNQDPTWNIEVSEGPSSMALRAKLDKLSCDLKEAEIINRQYIEDHATRLSQDHQTELVRHEVELETTKTIIHLQEEIDRLQSEFQVNLCSLAEQNLSLKNNLAVKEDELKRFSAEWERATLELTTFLIDGSRSLGDASCQIKSISSSFPNVNYWISENVEKAAKLCIEKEETILLLQKSLEDAQKTVMQMEQKLYTLKGATIALTELQQLEKSSCREEIQLSRNSTEVKDFLENKLISEKGQIMEHENADALLVENRMYVHSTNTNKGTAEGNLLLAHTNSYATTDVDVQAQLAMLILSEIENVVNRSCCDAETNWAALKSDIHDTISLYKELIKDLLRDFSEMRKDFGELKRKQGGFLFSNNTISSHPPLKHESQLQVPQEIRDELVDVNKRLKTTAAWFYNVMKMNCLLDSAKGSITEDGWTSDCLSSCSDSSVESVDNDEKSSSDIYKSTKKLTEQTLDLNCDKGSNLSRNRADLLFMKEFKKAYAAFVKLTDHLMEFCAGEINQSCGADDRSFSDPLASENLKEEGRDRHDQLTSQRVEEGIKNLRELAVDEKCGLPISFFTKFEEASATIEEADYTLKSMLKVNEDANKLIAMWKQAGEELMADKASLSEEIKQLKSCILLKDGEKEVLQDQINFSSREVAKILSFLRECYLQMQTGVEELFETASSCSLKSSLEDLVCKAMQNDISIFVLQCQIGENFHKIRRVNTISNSNRHALQEHCLITGGSDLVHVNGNDTFAFHAMRFENEGDQTDYESIREFKELDVVHINSDKKSSDSELVKELERKDILLKGLLFDFSLLQELASHRKDFKDELEKLILALSKVQHELQIKTVQLDDVLVQNKNLEGHLTEAERALLNSNSELDQAKGKINILLDQNVELKSLLKDLYLKNSEVEQLLGEHKETIKSLEKEIIRVSSLSEKQVIPSVDDIEDALTRATAERDQLVEKLTSFQDKLDMACALADENQAIAVEARQELEASKIYAEQKEEEVKILEHCVEELECTINVMEKKVNEMEEEVKEHRLRRDSMELEVQALRHRLLSVEDLTESMTSEYSKTSLPEDQLFRKLQNKCEEIREAHGRIRFLEEENATQYKEIKLFKDYISEILLHAEAQASQYKHKVCILKTRLATTESMTHDVIRDLLSVKLDISNYANIIDQHQLQKLIEEAQQQREEFVAKEQEIVNLRSQIDDLLEERERCISEINNNKEEQLTTQIILEQVQERDQLLMAQNDMLKKDKSNLQKKVVELDDMVKKLFKIQDSQPCRNQPQTNSLLRPLDSDLNERLLHSQRMLSRINNQSAQYRRSDANKQTMCGNETNMRKQKP
ncbi:hypothetical protein RD792_017674 [Penstemon davidsonii]|uniref:Kinesin motor domain-containing protein n=1 Tax=Penstemon davidsonii TaxID=160366 RepID=A0ABR0DWG6_9LAMI|nr:hypothetical protein RD792_017674 [Penstemon davidsonii]